MKIMLVHGIGNVKTGWSQPETTSALLGVEPTDIIEFTYEDLLDKSCFTTMFSKAIFFATAKWFPLAEPLTPIITDFISDVFVYYDTWFKNTRMKILNRLLESMDTHNPDVIIGFSLGSVVAYEGLGRMTLKNHTQNTQASFQVPTLITVGSPLGGLVGQIMNGKLLASSKQGLPKDITWINVYSKLDPISGKINKKLAPKMQIKTACPHDFLCYLSTIGKLLKHL